MTELLTDPDAVRVALESDEYTMPPVEPAYPGIAWLRAAVARFSDGPAHTRQRGYAVDLLAALDPDHLRTRAHDRAAATLAECGDPVDVMSAIARPVPVGVLANALGVHPDLTPAVAAAARSYQPHTAPRTGPAEADAAVATLVAAFGGTADEPTAARIGLLVQACDATAGLIVGAIRAGWGRALHAHTDTDGAGSERRVEAVLRREPPVRRTRRMLDGREVHLDITTLPFGAGRHACPGREHAIAIATGVLDALDGWQVVPGQVHADRDGLRVCRTR
jgi:cytochrome P450